MKYYEKLCLFLMLYSVARISMITDDPTRQVVFLVIFGIAGFFFIHIGDK